VREVKARITIAWEMARICHDGWITRAMTCQVIAQVQRSAHSATQHH
jgi:hypothetical protein